MDWLFFYKSASLGFIWQASANLKGQKVKALGFGGHKACAAAPQLCFCSTEADPDGAEKKGCGCIAIKLYLEKQAASSGHGLSAQSGVAGILAVYIARSVLQKNRPGFC